MTNYYQYLFYALGFIVLVSIFLYFFQEYFLFRPEKLPQDFEFQYQNQEVEEYHLEINENTKLNGLHFKSKASRGLVFYLKGNSRSIKGWGKFAVDFTSQGWDVFIAIGREVDTIVGKNHKSAIVTLTERKSQFKLMAKTDGTKAASIRKQMINLLAPFKELVKTITSDNGKEFTEHQQISKKLDADFFLLILIRLGKED